MKLISCVIRPDRLPAVKEALFRAGVTGITITRASGHGGEQDTVAVRRGTRLLLQFHEKVKIEMACSEPFVFAAGKYGVPTPTGQDVSTVVTELFYGGGLGTLKAQFIGSAAVTAAAFASAMVLMYAVKATGTLRVAPEGELEGLDIHEHGSSAYPEYMISGSESVILSVSARDDAA